MSNVISMENAAARRGRTLNYLGSLMATNGDELLSINLPLNGADAPVSVLVLLTAKQKQTARLILSEEGTTTTADYTLITPGGQIPAEFGAKSLGDLTAFMAGHRDELDAVVAASATTIHGHLTLARAVHALVTGKEKDAAAALATAVDTSARCATWKNAVASLARNIAAS